MLPGSSTHQILFSFTTILWILGSLYALYMANSKNYRKAAGLFGLICTFSVMVTVFIDQSIGVFFSTTPMFIIPLLVSYLYGNLKSSILLSLFILSFILSFPFLSSTIKFEFIIGPLVYLTTCFGILIVAHFQRKVEKKLLTAERERSIHDMRLRSMGELTANIAHQMGTPLTVIEMAIENARENFKAGQIDQAIKQLQISEDTIFRSKRFIETLKNLYQPQKVSHGTCTLSWIISQVRLFYGPRLAQGKVVLTGPGEYLHEPIPLPGEDLLQCVLNLVDNGLHALKGQANASIKLSLKKEEHGLTLVYSDNGPGIKAENQSKIFDPFFTTKEQGEGTGLGLAITQAILRRHQAEISLMPDSGAGATFKIEFSRRQ